MSSSAACHTRTFPLQVNQCRLDPVLSGSLLALTLTKTTVGLWDLRDSGSNPVSLVGHTCTVSALGFSCSEPRLLCSVAEDYLIIWNVSQCLYNVSKGQPVRGEVILTKPGDVSHVCFSQDAGRIALCTEVVVKVVGMAQRCLEVELTGHGARVSGAEFCPHYLAMLVSVSDDRTACVWDVQVPSLLYQTCMLGAAPLLCLAMNPLEPQVALASAGGEVRVMDLRDGQNIRQLCQFSVGKMLARGRHAQARSTQHGDGPLLVNKGGVVRKGEGATTPEGEAIPCSIEASDGVLSVMYVCGENMSSFPSGKGGGGSSGVHGAVGEVLVSSSPVLVVVSTHGAVQIHTRTLEVLSTVDFLQPVPSMGHPLGITLGAMGLAGAGWLSPSLLVLVLGTLFESCTHCLQWELAPGSTAALAGSGQDTCHASSPLAEVSNGEQLSMVASRPLTEHSPLKAEFVLQTATSPTSKNNNSHRGLVGRAGSKLDPMNQPLTFKSKVKSSGYSQAPRTTMFQPQINTRPRDNAKTKVSDKTKIVDLTKTSSRKTEGLGSRLGSQAYPQDAGPPSQLDCSLPTPSPPSPVTCLRFSTRGHYLACSQANKTALVYPAPFGHKESSVLVGHDAAINSVAWSNSSKFLLTTSSDRTAVVWERTSGESLLVFSSFLNNFKDNQDKPKARASFSKEVKGAQFYYMDKFVLLITGNQLCLYKYHLDPSKDEIRRYLTKSRYKLVQSWDTASQNFTAMTAPNTFYSHLGICAGSNRSIEIYDLNEGRLAHVFSDAHTKAIHCLALNEGSAFTSQPQGALNVVASTANQDCVRLWDVRGRRCVLRLEGHINQALGCGIAFSPCGTYLGTGSEDRLVYLYDIRQGAVCSKLRGHSDAVTSVAFDPARPLLATGAIDGKVLLFKA